MPKARTEGWERQSEPEGGAVNGRSQQGTRSPEAGEPVPITQVRRRSMATRGSNSGPFYRRKHMRQDEPRKVCNQARRHMSPSHPQGNILGLPADHAGGTSVKSTAAIHRSQPQSAVISRTNNNYSYLLDETQTFEEIQWAL